MRLALVLLVLAACGPTQLTTTTPQPNAEKCEVTPLDVSDADDWNRWWCYPDFCERQRTDCDDMLVGYKEQGLIGETATCERYLRAACFRYRNQFKGGTLESCFPSMEKCRDMRDFTVTNPDGADLIEECMVRE